MPVGLTTPLLEKDNPVQMKSMLSKVFVVPALAALLAGGIGIASAEAFDDGSDGGSESAVTFDGSNASDEESTGDEGGEEGGEDQDQSAGEEGGEDQDQSAGEEGGEDQDQSAGEEGGEDQDSGGEEG
ncbi:MAG: hypothetical protein LLG14_07520 [Nocardiaceae bacterium]|nr:hypothetical protein [Nocardiaceae bacterium]